MSIRPKFYVKLANPSQFKTIINLLSSIDPVVVTKSEIRITSSNIDNNPIRSEAIFPRDLFLQYYLQGECLVFSLHIPEFKSIISSIKKRDSLALWVDQDDDETLHIDIISSNAISNSFISISTFKSETANPRIQDDPNYDYKYKILSSDFKNMCDSLNRLSKSGDEIALHLGKKGIQFRFMSSTRTVWTKNILRRDYFFVKDLEFECVEKCPVKQFILIEKCTSLSSMIVCRVKKLNDVRFDFNTSVGIFSIHVSTSEAKGADLIKSTGDDLEVDEDISEYPTVVECAV